LRRPCESPRRYDEAIPTIPSNYIDAVTVRQAHHERLLLVTLTVLVISSPSIKPLSIPFVLSRDISELEPCHLTTPLALILLHPLKPTNTPRGRILNSGVPLLRLFPYHNPVPPEKNSLSCQPPASPRIPVSVNRIGHSI